MITTGIRSNTIPKMKSQLPQLTGEHDNDLFSGVITRKNFNMMEHVEKRKVLRGKII